MTPLLCDGCGAVVEHISEDIELGDVVVYYQGEVLTIHRVVNVTETQDGFLYRTKGDNCLNLDPSSVKRGEIIGRVVGVMRGGSIVKIDNKEWRKRGHTLARYSYFVGSVCAIVKSCTKLLFKDKDSTLVSSGGRALLFVFSLWPRLVSTFSRLRSDAKKKEINHTVL